MEGKEKRNGVGRREGRAYGLSPKFIFTSYAPDLLPLNKMHPVISFSLANGFSKRTTNRERKNPKGVLIFNCSSINHDFTTLKRKKKRLPGSI